MANPDAPARASGSTVVVPSCPFCKHAHTHPAHQTGMREAPCGKGVYRVLVCLKAGEKADAPVEPEKPKSRWGKKR